MYEGMKMSMSSLAFRPIAFISKLILKCNGFLYASCMLLGVSLMAHRSDLALLLTNLTSHRTWVPSKVMNLTSWQADKKCSTSLFIWNPVLKSNMEEPMKAKTATWSIHRDRFEWDAQRVFSSLVFACLLPNTRPTLLHSRLKQGSPYHSKP